MKRHVSRCCPRLIVNKDFRASKGDLPPETNYEEVVPSSEVSGWRALPGLVGKHPFLLRSRRQLRVIISGIMGGLRVCHKGPKSGYK